MSSDYWFGVATGAAAAMVWIMSLTILAGMSRRAK